MSFTLAMPAFASAALISDAAAQSCTLLAIAAAMTLLLRNHSAAVRHRIWCLAFGGVLLVPILSVIAPRWEIAVFPSTAVTEPRRTLDARPRAMNERPQGERLTGFSRMPRRPVDLLGHAEPPDPTQPAKAVEQEPLGLNELARGSEDGVVRETSDSNLVLLLFGVWAAGAGLIAVPLLGDVVRKRTIGRHARPIDSAAWTEALRLLCHAMQITRPVRVWVTEDEIIPMTWGILRPVILVPGSSLRWHPQRRQLVLLHELAHVRRFDLPLQLLARVACAVYWFNPLAWYGWHRFRVERELACDDLVLASGVRPSDYATELIDIAQSHQSRRMASAVAMASTSQLESRVRSMLDGARSHHPLTGRASVALSVAAGCVLMIAAIVHPVTSVAGADDAPPSRTGPSPPSAVRSTVDSIGDPLPEGALLRLGTLRFRHPSHASSVVLSPDEQSLITVGSRLFVWDTRTGAEKWRSDAEAFQFNMNVGYCIQPVAFGSESRQFFAIGNPGEINVYNIETGDHETVTLTYPNFSVENAKRAFDLILGGDGKGLLHPRNLVSIDVTADAILLAIGTSDGVDVCDRAGKVAYRIANKVSDWPTIDNMNRDRLSSRGPYSSGRFSPKGDLLAVAASDQPKLIRLHDAESGDELRRVELQGRPVQFEFTSDGRQIVVTERDNAVRLYDVATGERVWSQVVQLNNRFENYTSAVASTPDGQTVVAGATDHRIYLFDAATGAPTGSLTGHRWYPWGLAVTADSKMLYSSGWDGAIRRWDLTTQQQLPLPDGFHATEVAAASPDGRSLAYVDDRGTVRIVDTEDGAETQTFRYFDSHHSQLTFSPDGRILAAGGSINEQVQVILWDLARGEQRHRFTWPKGRDPHSHVEELRFTPDGRRLAAAVFRQSASYLWDLTTGQQVAKLPHQEVYGLSFSPDGTTLATAGWDKIVRFWDAETGKLAKELKVSDAAAGEDLRMYTVCYSPLGETFATAHLDGSVRVWDAEKLTVQTKFAVEHRFSYGAMSYSPDGLWLATGNATGRIDLWDPITGQNVWNRGRQQDNMYTVSFGRDSRKLLTAGDDGVAYLWDLHPPNLPNKPLTEILDDFLGRNSGLAYRAMWVLQEDPTAAVPLLAKTLPSAIRDNAPSGDDEKRLLRTSPATIATRAVTLLTQMESAEATRLLITWSKEDPDGLLGKTAFAALNRGWRYE